VGAEVHENPDNIACGDRTDLPKWHSLVSHDFRQGGSASGKRLPVLSLSVVLSGLAKQPLLASECIDLARSVLLT
jgi:hypothetical protein